MFNKITASHISHFESILKKQSILYDEENLLKYSTDYTLDHAFMPEIILFPESTHDVSAILMYCNNCKLPVTPRGAGTSLSGGALTVYGGVLLSLEKMNRILEIDTQNLQATVEPGVINEDLQNKVKESGLFYPPDPASKGSCMMGGNVAHSSGGPKCVKYGTTKDYILNLEVVLPSGQVMWTGANTLKNSTGYNLTQLMIGSEGTLGVVTKIVVRLIPNPTHTLLLLVPFENAEAACGTVPKIFAQGIVPSALEFMEKSGMEITCKQLQIPFNFSNAHEAYLLIEVDGNNPDILMKDCEIIFEILESNKAGEVLLAESSDQKELFWRIRRSIGETVKNRSVYKEEDTVVPRASLAICYRKIKEIAQKQELNTVIYGHAGDGNLHVNILKDHLDDLLWEQKVSIAATEIFKVCKELKGTISGEHGIGYVQKKYMKIIFPDFQLELMKGIKNVFDPNGILNPGKIFN